MDSAEKIVELYARHSRALATIANIPCDGAHEINLLAIDPANPTRRFHIEVNVSPGAVQTPRTRRAFDDLITNKFNSAPVGKKLRQYGFEATHYQKVLVARSPTPTLRAAAADAGVELWNFKSLLQELAKRFKDNPSHFAADALATLDQTAKAKLDLEYFAKGQRSKGRLTVVQLWNSRDAKVWEHYQGEFYDAGVKPEQLQRERQLEKPGLRARLARMSAPEFCHFLRDEYFPLKFTVKSQHIAAVKALMKHQLESSMDLVETARQRLVNRVYDSKADAIGMLMGKHGGIHGLTAGGASGLLALVYPEEFAPVDVGIAKALRQIGAQATVKASVKDVSIAEAEAVIDILRTKALELNRAFATNDWTPRRVARALGAAES